LFFKQWGCVGTKAAGRALGDRVWKEMPAAAALRAS
jgi:protein gp37